jgi:large subunit ribosomal protein L5
MVRLQELYKEKIIPELMARFGYKNILAVPRLRKVVVNMGVGEAADNKKRLEDAVRDLATITGQKPLVTRAKKSVSGFKLREGVDIGCKVTLRGKRMYEFLDRLISLAMPRIRDFRGFSPKASDGRGNYSLGLSEQTVFPEIDIDKVEFIQGMDITLVISGGNDDASRELLSGIGFPFQRAEGADAS